MVILFFIGFLARRVEIPMRPLAGGVPEPKPLTDDKLPGLLWSLMPILLPVLLISTNTVAKTIAARPGAGPTAQGAVEITSLIGNANLAMLLAAAVAIIGFLFSVLFANILPLV